MLYQLILSKIKKYLNLIINILNSWLKVAIYRNLNSLQGHGHGTL